MRKMALSTVIACALATAFSLYAQSQVIALTNDDVVKMERASLDEALILAIIQCMPAHFSVDPDSLKELRRQGASEDIISGILRKSSAASRPVSGQSDADSIYGSCPGKRPEVRYRIMPEHQWVLDAGLTGYSATYSLVINADGTVRDAQIEKLTGSIRRGQAFETIDIPDSAKERLSQRLLQTVAKWRFDPCLVDQQPVLFRITIGSSSS